MTNRYAPALVIIAGFVSTLTACGGSDSTSCQAGDCVAPVEICDDGVDNNGDGVVDEDCEPACTDECPAADAIACDAGAWRRCQVGAEGCLVWSAAEACSTGTCSDAATCLESPPAPPADVIPNVAGVWLGTWNSSTLGIAGVFKVEIVQQDGNLSGTISVSGGITLADVALTGTVTNDSFTFGDINNVIVFSGALSSSADRGSGGYTYATLSDTGAWQANKTVAAGVCVNIDGTWDIVETISSTSCGSGEGDSTQRRYTIVQSACRLVATDGARAFAGTVSNNQASWLGSFADNGGTTTITAMSLTVVGDTKAVIGTASWTWTGGSTCGGTTSIRGGRADIEIYLISLPKTGQTTCYDAAGALLSCPGTLQDGDLQAGASWPSQRFDENPDETLTDQLTGLIWPKDANNPGPAACSPGLDKTWAAAFTFVQCLNTETYLGHSDWRLPNINELTSLLNDGVSDWPTWLESEGFENTSPDAVYWSSTTPPGDATNAFYIYSASGIVNQESKKEGSLTARVLPVRGGQGDDADFAYPANIAKTGQTTCFDADGSTLASCVGTLQDGELQRGVAWPEPRFRTETGDDGGVVEDALTGLVWVQSEAQPSTDCTSEYFFTWEEALAYVSCINAHSYLGYSDWRMPNRLELRSLINYGEASSIDWLSAQGFHLDRYIFWSSSNSVANPANARVVALNDGLDWTPSKSEQWGVFPVRAGW